MKKFSQAIALVAVTTLFATAFTTSYHDQHATNGVTATASSTLTSDSNVAQVVIVGKRMTALEKTQYDAQQSGLQIAVK